MKSSHLICWLFLAGALKAHSQSFSTDPADYEKILIPVAIADSSVHGANGAIWSTRFVIRNDANVAVALFAGNPFNCAFHCTPQEPPPTIDPRSSFVAQATAIPYAYGDIYYVNRVYADDVFFLVQLIESSSAPVETEMPVVRESEFRHEKVILPEVPLRSGSSEILRVYDPNDHPGIVMTVRVFSSEDVLLGERTVSPFYEGHWTPPDFENWPGFSQIELLEFFPNLQEPQRVRVEVEAPGIEFWAFVSVTDRTTHHVSLYTPQ